MKLHKPMASLLLLAVLCCPLWGTAQYKNIDTTYRKDVASVHLYNTASPVSQPLMSIAAEETLSLEFDVLTENAETFYYTVKQCNANWSDGELFRNDYLEGFESDEIIDYNFSFNTIQDYVHYYLEFPNPRMRVLKTGNYILNVFTEREEEPVFTRRFVVYENLVTFSGQVEQSIQIDERESAHRLSFKLGKGRVLLANPMRNLSVTVLQNFEWGRAVTGLKPRSISGSELIFDYTDGRLTFEGLSEFRRFDAKSLRVNMDRVMHLAYNEGVNHVFLYDDEAKTYLPYEKKADINGAFFHKTDDYDNPLQTDYTLVHFFLKYKQPLPYPVYIVGGMTDWNRWHTAKMRYNYEEGGYEGELFLKQGLYNYRYVLADPAVKGGNYRVFEGSHRETENQYTIIVYNRAEGSIYDQAVGVFQINFK